MTTRHTVSHADESYVGNVHYEGYSPDGRRGIKIPTLFTKEYGAIVTADPNGIAALATQPSATALTGTLSATGALVSGGVATFDVPRIVVVTSATTATGQTFTVTGTDEYGEALVETIQGNTATGPRNGVKAFKTVTSITYVSLTATIATGIDVGSGDTFGFPVKVADKGDIVALSVDGYPAAVGVTIVPCSTEATQTATTPDVRGTWTVTTASNGTIAFTVLSIVGDRSTKESVFGADQYGG